MNFDGITYAKGASVLKQLVAYVGLEPFLAGLRGVLRRARLRQRHLRRPARARSRSPRAATCPTGATQWLKTTGLNILRPEFDVDADGAFTRSRCCRTAPRPVPASHVCTAPAVGIYDDSDGKLVRTDRIELDVDAAARTEVPELVGVARGK